MKHTSFIAACVLSILTACNSAGEKVPAYAQINADAFEGTTPDGKQTHLFTLTNANGMEVKITNYGARIVSIVVPDKDGVKRDVVLGFDNIGDYQTIESDFGANIGRYANRIDHAKFTLNGVEYQLPVNNDIHCLHGGCSLNPPTGWQYMAFDATQQGNNQLTLTYDSPDGEAGFPGNVKATTVYTLTDQNEIDIRYTATTDQPTVINETNHSYFNLNGDATQLITNHKLYINADQYTVADNTFMPTGEIAQVEGTPMDFRTFKTVGDDIDSDFEQVQFGHGFDHNWVLNTKGDDKTVAAAVYSPTTGIKLEMLTNEPGVQVYSGNFLDGTVTGKGGIVYQKRAAICLESQKFPDSPNKGNLEGWYSAVLNPGETYNSHCIFRFSIQK